MDDIGVYKSINCLYKKMIREKIMTADEAHAYRMRLLDHKIKAENAAIETADLIIKKLTSNVLS